MVGRVLRSHGIVDKEDGGSVALGAVEEGAVDGPARATTDSLCRE
jgi:hypothetical protein